MASMRDIKRRKSSITSTQQITKAMKLVSTVKLQKARAHAEATDPYFNYMYRTVSSMLAKSGNLEHPYLKAGEETLTWERVPEPPMFREPPAMLTLPAV